jgi:hypothetical protein
VGGQGSERSPGERSDTRVSNRIEVLHATNTLGDADQLRDAATPLVASTSVRPAVLSRPTGSFAEGSRGLNLESHRAADNFEYNLSSRIKVISIIRSPAKIELPFFRKYVLFISPSRLDTKGRYGQSSRNVGRDAVDATRSCAHEVAGRGNS